MNEAVVPAQTGWRAVRVMHEVGMEPFLLHDVPIVAWRVYDSSAAPIAPFAAESFHEWINDADKEENGRWVLVSPDGRVFESGGGEYDRLEDYMMLGNSLWQTEKMKGNPKIQPSPATPR